MNFVGALKRTTSFQRVTMNNNNNNNNESIICRVMSGLIQREEDE